MRFVPRSMALKSTLTAYELHAALSALEIPPALALRDPVHAMRYAASAPEGAIREALRAVLVEVPEMEGDELRLFGAAVLGRVLVGVRERARQRVTEEVRAVPV